MFFPDMKTCAVRLRAAVFPDGKEAESALETYQLTELSITYGGAATRLSFSSARLVIVSDAGYKLWYVEVDGMTQHDLLRRFNETDQLGVALNGITAGGRPFAGSGYFHPNEQHHAAAIRGDGELPGF